MAKHETDIVHAIMKAATGALFKNVRGMFYTRDDYPIKAGLLADGSSDLIGFTSIEVTPEMVGKTLPVFTAIEAKTAKGVVRPEQKQFIATVKDKGGIAGVARSVEDYEKIVIDWRTGFR